MRQKWIRVLSFVLVLAMSLTMVSAQGLVQTRAEVTNTAIFTDLPDDWSRPALERAVANGLLQGSNGKIDADGLLTRAQLAAIVARAFGAVEEADLSAYTDVAVGAWYRKAMAQAVAMGVMTGNGAKLSPDAPITRQETMVVLARAFGMTDGGLDAIRSFADHRSVSDWAEESVAAMVEAGYVSGNSQNRLEPLAHITRAEFAQIMDNMVKAYLTDADGKTVKGNVVVREAGTVLEGVTIQGDLVIGDGVADGNVVLKNVTVTGRIIVRGGDLILESAEADHVEVLGSHLVVELDKRTEVSSIHVDEDAEDVTILVRGEVDYIRTDAWDTVIDVDGGYVGEIDKPGKPSKPVNPWRPIPPVDPEEPEEPEEAEITVGFLPAQTVEEGQSLEVTVEAEASNGADVTVTAAPGNETVASVAVDGKTLVITGVKAGMTAITVEVSAEDCEMVTRHFLVTVTAAEIPEPLPITLTKPADVALEPADVETVTVTVDPADSVLTVKSSDASVASVTVKGNVLTVTAVKAGTATITVTANKEGYAQAETSFVVTVTEPAPLPITLTKPADVALEPADVETVTVTVDPADSVLTVKSSDASVASVTVKGNVLTVTAVKAGTATITVTANKEGYAQAETSFVVTVTEPAPLPITLTKPADATLDVTDVETVTVTVDPADCVLTVKSSEEAVASVTVSGNVLTVNALSAGTATITVTASKEGYVQAETTFVVTVNEPVVEELGRRVFNFNAGWKFSKGQGFDNAESNRDVKKEVIVIPNTETPYKTDYDVSSWEDVSLPHTYNDVDTFDNFTENNVKTHGSAGMNGERSVYGGTAWYKKTFTVPAEYEGKKIFLEFEAARQAAEVYINGVKLEGKSENGFIPFGYDLTEYIVFGGENDVTVMTDNSFPYYHIDEKGGKHELSWADSHWHPNNGGLYRNAFLYVTDPLHVTLPLYSFLETQGTYVYTQNETEKTAEVVMEAEIQNEYDKAVTFTYVSEVLDMDGKVVLTETSEALTLEPGAKEMFRLKGTLNDPKRWSTEYPYLYEVVSKILVDGEEVDSTTTPLGVRTFRFTNDFGFYLNENYVKLQGWGQKPTDEWAGLGAAYPDWMHAYTQELMKDAGGNFIRWGHCAGSPNQISISDQYGMVTLQPGVDGEGSTVGGVYSAESYEVRKNAFRDMIIYFRNNPSIFLWELGNQSMPDAEAKALTEIVYQYDGHGMADPSKKLNSGKYDDTIDASNRLLAVRRGNNVMSKYIDVSVTTLGDWELKADGKPGVEGENNREEARRGVWDRYTEGFENFHTPSGSSYDLTDEQFAANQAKEYNSKIKAVAHSGGGNWIFSDSTSHGRVYSEVSRASGEVDGVRLPKEAYYTLKTIYTDEVDVYLIGHWNYKAGTVKDVYATSDAASVKLVVTDEQGGTTEYTGVKSSDYLFTFSSVKFVPGSATAIAYDKAGKEVGRSTKATHGEAVALKLTAITGPEGLLANGSDVLLLDVEAVDAQGNRCLTFDGTVNKLQTTFTVNDGDGTCIWRGGYNSGIEHSTNNKYLYLQAGLNRVAVRTTMKAGDITVTAHTDGLQDATITVASQAVDNTNGLNTALNQIKKLPLGQYQGVGDGSKPEVDDGTEGESKSALLKEAFYTGSTNLYKVAFPAMKGEKVYSDSKTILFGELPIELLNSEYFQIPQADANMQGATDVVALRFARDVNLYIAHDDAIQPRPQWLVEEYTDTGMDITINGHTHSVFTKAFKADESVTIESNVVENMTVPVNQYVILVKEQGQEKTFLKDDFEGQKVGESPAGWNVNAAPDTSAKIAEIDGNKVLELIDTNTGAAPNMALASRKFLPQYGKLSLEYSIYDYDLKVGSKNQDFIRIFLLHNAPSTDPNDHTNTVVESYLRSGSYLKARYGNSVDVNIKQLAANQWFDVKYIVDMAAKRYDVYVKEGGEYVLAKSGIQFRNEHDFVDHLVLGSGGGSGTHVLLDNVKIDLIDNALTDIQVNGLSLSDFKPETYAYSNTLAVGTTEAPVVTATARDPYATVEIRQADSVNGAATITVTALNGDVQVYTVQFEVAQEVNTTLEAILLDGKALSGFDAATTAYDIVLAPEAAYPVVTATPVAAGDEVVVSGADKVTITVNGVGTYTVTFTKADYEFNDGFESGALGENWTVNHSAASSANAASIVDGNNGKVLQLADTDSKSMLFAHAKLAHTYDSVSLAGKKIVLEWDLNPSSTQQWIRGLFSKSTDLTNNGKNDMAVEVYTNVTKTGSGDVKYKNSTASNAANLTCAPDGTVKMGEWNHMVLEVLPDRGLFRVTVTNSAGTKTFASGTDAIRVNDGGKTTFAYAQFGTGNGAMGNVLVDNVQVYVCSDIG